MPPKLQTINLGRVRLSGPWAAWWAIFCVAVIGVWYIRGAKDAGKQVVVEVNEVAIEVEALRSEMKQARDEINGLNVRVSTLMVELFNKTGGSITINYDAATPTAGDGIFTPSGANVTWPNLTAARFAYDRAVSRWRLLNTPQ